MRAGEHGPDRLYDKFEVRRKRTGELLGEDGEFLFVLRPERDDDAAVAALHEYARVCERKGYGNLARQIRERLPEGGQVERVCVLECVFAGGCGHRELGSWAGNPRYCPTHQTVLAPRAYERPRDE